MDEFPAALRNFCALLRDEHGFRVGVGEMGMALRAAEHVNIADLDAVRLALRLILCARYEELEPFDAAFTAFFFPATAGTSQPNLPPTQPPKTRPSHKRSESGNSPTAENAPPEPGEQEQDDEFSGSSAQRTPTEDDEDAQPSPEVTRGRFSAVQAEPDAPQLPQHELGPMLRAAAQFMGSLRLGRSRQWRAMPKGSRFDFRRTLRRSLATGGDALHPHWKGHPRRNPRIVVLLDGSRSMLENAAPVLEFSYALTQRSRRVDVFTFSTELRDITPELGKQADHTPPELSKSSAWGGGTRIGESLQTFLHEHASRVLTPDTLVIISSDGLDVGDVDTLAFAMRELRRRSAGIVWLNPHAAHPKFRPTARGMRAALPYLSALTHAQTPEEFANLGVKTRLQGNPQLYL